MGRRCNVIIMGPCYQLSGHGPMIAQPALFGPAQSKKSGKRVLLGAMPQHCLSVSHCLHTVQPCGPENIMLSAIHSRHLSLNPRRPSSLICILPCLLIDTPAYFHVPDDGDAGIEE